MTDLIPPADPESDPDAVAADPARMRPRRSGRALALGLLGALALAAGADTAFGHAATWIRVERVLGVWWVVWVLVLASLLRRGALVTDDHRWDGPRFLSRLWTRRRDVPLPAATRPAAPRRGGANGPSSAPVRSAAAPRRSGSTSGDGPRDRSLLDGLDGCSTVSFDGCDGGIAMVVAGILLVLGLVVLVDLVIPAVFAGAYALVRGLVVQATRGGISCRGRWGASFLRAALWSTVYLAPAALVTVAVHLLRTRG